MASAFEAKLILSDFQKSVDLITQQREKLSRFSSRMLSTAELSRAETPFSHKMTWAWSYFTRDFYRSRNHFITNLHYKYDYWCGIFQLLTFQFNKGFSEAGAP